MENIKKIILNKRIMAVLLLLITLISNVSPVLAASGTGTWHGQQFDSKIQTTEYIGKPYRNIFKKFNR